jgi:uncharacterized phage-associated protein
MMTRGQVLHAQEALLVSQVYSLAKELVKLSLQGDESDPLTHLRLQKLLYYAQAWSLVLRDAELFPEEIIAWENGPVVEEVYRKLPDGRCAACVPEDTFASAPDLEPEDALFLKHFWEAYSGHSASQLNRMTHSEIPWQKTWNDRPNENAPIPVQDIEEYFSRQTVPAPLAAYCHDLRRREEEAEMKLREIPPIDVGRFRATATSFTPTAIGKAAGG